MPISAAAATALGLAAAGLGSGFAAHKAGQREDNKLNFAKSKITKPGTPDAFGELLADQPNRFADERQRAVSLTQPTDPEELDRLRQTIQQLRGF